MSDLLIALFAALLGAWSFLVLRREQSHGAFIRSLSGGPARPPAGGSEGTPAAAPAPAAFLPARVDTRLGRSLARAGFRSRLAHRVMVVLRVVAMAAALLLVAKLWGAAQTPAGFAWPHEPADAVMLFSPFAAAGLVAIVPDLLLALLGRRRREAIRMDVPFFLDQVVMLHKAGVGFDEAVQTVCRERSAPLHDEFHAFIHEVRYGLPRVRAWKNLSLRLDLEEVDALAGTMIQSEQIGAGLADALEAQATSARERRFEQALERAHKLPVQLVFPLVICFFPSLFLVTLGPSLLRFFDLFGVTLER